MIFLHVTEPQHVHGKNITLHVNGCEPLMNFDDSRSIFHEQFFVEKIQDFVTQRSVSIVSCVGTLFPAVFADWEYVT